MAPLPSSPGEHEKPSGEATTEPVNIPLERSREELLRDPQELEEEYKEFMLQYEKKKHELEEEMRRSDARMRRIQEEKRQQQHRLEPLQFVDFIQYWDEKVFATFWVDGKGKPPKGLADVSGKMYPRFLRPWTDFAAQHTHAFNELRTRLDDGPAKLMSLDAIEKTSESLRGERAITNKRDVHAFVHTAIERPASAIMAAYSHARWRHLSPSDRPFVVFGNNAFLQQRQSKWPIKRLSQSVPDRWAVMPGDLSCPPRNIFVGQYKPPYVLKASMLERVMATVPGDTFFSEAILGAQQQAKSTTAPGDGGDGDGGGDEADVSDHILVAKTLCQAYHHILGSGCRFGYVLSGDSLILLRVELEDPETMYYHSVRFVVPPYEDLRGRQQFTRALRQPHETAVAYMASLCLWAIETSWPRPLNWIEAATMNALRWPSQKERKGGPKLQHTLREDDDGGRGPFLTPHLPLPPGPRKRGRPAIECLSYSSCLQPEFCTQACLLGLTRGLALDDNCPNVKLHRAYRSVSSIKARTDAHLLTAANLRLRVVAQIADNVDKHCACRDDFRWAGRYSTVFHITVAGYGYTFVGKSVQAEDAKVLENEALVYNAVPQLQGRLIPVFLGIIKLARPITLQSCIRVSHMMLLSYAGPSFRANTKQHPPGVDLKAECRRTGRELRRAGVVNMDVNSLDVAWNPEVRRVMHYDFDEVCLDSLPTAAKGGEGGDETKTDWNDQREDVSSHDPDDGRAAKRTRTADDDEV